MKLAQGQIWKTNEHYIRIVQLERMAVAYKLITDLKNREGEHLSATKKEFCRMIKDAVLMSPEDIYAAENLP